MSAIGSLSSNTVTSESDKADGKTCCSVHKILHLYVKNNFLKLCNQTCQTILYSLSALP